MKMSERLLKFFQEDKRDFNNKKKANKTKRKKGEKWEY